MKLEDILTNGGEMGTLIRAFDWSKTPLGPIVDWPYSLKIAVNILLASRFPMQILWGPEYIQFYNDAYRPILGNKHPQSLGQRGEDCWPEVWDFAGPRLERVRHTGEASWSDDQLLLLDRHGYVEECYFTFSYTPVRDESGNVAGIFNVVNETTQRVIGERRQKILGTLAARVTEAKTVEAVCENAAKTLANNLADVPFALFYILDPNKQRGRLVSKVGLKDDSPLLLSFSTIDLDVPFLAKVVRTRKIDLLTLQGKWDGLPTEPWGEPPHSALILPMLLPRHENPIGFLIAGISPRRSLDENYRQFFELITNNVVSAIANIRAYEHERKRNEELDKFAYVVSHDLRAPLRAISNLSQWIEEDLADRLPEENQQQMQLLRQRVYRMEKLIDDLLEYSRLGRTQNSLETVNVAQLLAEVIDSLDPPSTFTITIDSRMPTLTTQPLLLNQVFANLIGNAIEHHPRRDGRIEISVEVKENWYQFTVADDGQGIAPEHHERIFAIFQTLKTTSNSESTGVGLSIVKKIVEIQGGVINLESQLGKGTTFRFTWPQ